VGPRVLVTGAGGFIGSHLTDTLIERGYDVRALVRYGSTGSWGWLERWRNHPDVALDVVQGDITDARLVRTALEGCDAVLHLAALIGIPYSYRGPSSYVHVNVGGTLTLLEAARDVGTKRIVITSTSEVYGTARTTPITEDHPRQAQSPYSASKIAADALAQAWSRSFGLPVVVLRPFNTFGPRQSPRAIIPTILGQLLSGAPELRLGNLEPQRDFTFVSDTVEGFLRTLDSRDIDGQDVHLGTGAAVSVGELAALCQEVVGRNVPIVHDEVRDRPPDSEVGLLLSDPSKAAALLDWRPTVSLRDGLARTAESMRDALPADAAFAW
jgi:NAD dependent epimerase/dehydratase